MESISACLIVKNEEAVLYRCLESLSPWVDEVIIVDTGSTDRTLEIAKKYTSKVLTFAWCDNFSAARNYSLEQASGTWILWVDADDIIPEDTGIKLRLLAQSASSHTGYFALHYVYPKEYNHFSVRRYALFRNDPCIRFQGRVHEQIYDPIEHRKFQVVETELEIIHATPAVREADILQKKLFYLKLLELDAAECPHRPYTWYHLGAAYHADQQFKKAIDCYHKYLSFNLLHDTAHQASCYSLLLEAYQALHESEKAAAIIAEALPLFPSHPELLVKAADHFTALGKNELAIGLLKHLISLEFDVLPDLSSPHYITLFPYIRLGNLLLEAGTIPEAIIVFRQGLHFHPNQEELLWGLCRAYHQNNATEALFDLINQVERISPDKAARLRDKLKSSHIIP
jgi:glycosyltransferase involved in cell wall biosynthesis